MINILRKNQKALWIVIAFLCIPFIFYFQQDILGGGGPDNEFGTLYGRKISRVEASRSARMFNLARELGMQTFLQDMVVGATSENEAYAEFTWNQLVLRHEAERLGLHPDSRQIVAAVKTLTPFRGQNGLFDSNKFDEFTRNALPALGFNEAQIEELVSDQLALQRLKEVLGGGVQIPEAEARENFVRGYGKLHVSIVRLRNEELAKDLKISDEEIGKYYEAHKAELNTEGKRKVNFVTFALTDEEKKLTGKERVEVLQKLADKANDFTQALLEKGAQFDQAAAKFELPIQTTGEFTQSAPDPLLKATPQLAAAAFQLTPQEPNSDALQVADGFYVLHLLGIEPARPLTLEEAKPKVVEAIKTERTRELVATKGAEAAQKIREALKSGAPIETATQQAGVTAEKIPPFALMDPPPAKPEPDKPTPPQTPDLQTIKGAVAELSPGEVSDVVVTPTGGIVAFMEQREQPDMAGYEAARAMFNARYTSGKREVAFYEWLRERRREAGVQSTPSDQTNPG